MLILGNMDNGFSIAFHARSQFSLLTYKQGKNVIIFDVHNSLSMHADNRKNDILVLIEGPQNGSDDSTITAEDTIISLNPKKIIFFESTLQCGQQCFEC